jgi:hypothetical protein
MHRACAQCGKYRGRAVLDVLKKATKIAAKAKAKGKEEAAAKPAKTAKK